MILMETLYMKTEKMLVVSDIHGALDGAEILLDALNVHHPSLLLCLGDILYHGPRNDLPSSYAPKKVIEIMNGLEVPLIAVRGNCEAEVDQMVLNFPVTSDYNIVPWGNRLIFMSHGHVYGPNKLPKMKEGDIFLSGHTHIPVCEKKDGVYLLNPGSVSLPKNSHPCSYGLFDETGFTVYTKDHEAYMHIDL